MSDWDDIGTSLDDEAYEAFRKREFGADGSVRGDPPVALIIWVLLGLVLVAGVWILT